MHPLGSYLEWKTVRLGTRDCMALELSGSDTDESMGCLLTSWYIDKLKRRLPIPFSAVAMDLKGARRACHRA